MPIYGLDFGCAKTVIAGNLKPVIEVIATPSGEGTRSIPSFVGFGPKNRFFGGHAKRKQVQKDGYAVGCLKRLAGRSPDDADIKFEQNFINVPLVGVNGQVGANVEYLEKKRDFTAIELIASFLASVRLVKKEEKSENKIEKEEIMGDVVISVPPWFTDRQRRAIMDAAEIAGLKVLRLINDTTAAALAYSITKFDLPPPEERPRRVAFVDMGCSSCTVSIVAFRNGELTVLSHAFDRHLGGRDFDKAIADHFAREFKEKLKLDILPGTKDRAKLVDGAENLKKVLSANSQAHIFIELGPNDASGVLKREQFEEIVKPLLDRVHAPLEQALKDAGGLVKEDIDAIELIGGSTRIPAVKKIIQQFFGKPLSYTLNQDEAVAIGCAWACAMLSPLQKVRDFTVHDIVSYPIEFKWEQSPDIPDEDTTLTVFNRNNTVPSTKILTFYRKEPFDLEARYTKEAELPGNTDPFIGKFSVKGVQPDSRDDFMICKLKTRLNLNGVLNIESGYYVEEKEVEEPIPEAPGEKKEGNDAAKAPPKTRVVKKQVKMGDLPIVGGTTSLDQNTKAALISAEKEMAEQDMLILETAVSKNSLETCFSRCRDNFLNVSTYDDFFEDGEKEKLRRMVEEFHDWNEDFENSDAEKSEYDERRAKLEEFLNMIEMRCAAEGARKAEEAAKGATGNSGGEKKDTEMTDAPVVGEPKPGLGDQPMEDAK